MKEGYAKRGYLLENFRLFHLRDAQGTKVDYHYHEFCKLLLLVSGSGGYAVEGSHYLLQPGDVVLLGSHCVHRPEFESGQAYERIILYISPAFLRLQSAEDCDLEACFSGEKGRVLRLQEGARNRLFALAGELEQTLARDRYGRAVLAASQLLQLLVELGRCLYRADTAKPAPLQPRDGRILELLRYLDGHLTEDLTIDQLAERFYVSKYHMMRRFREETGSTIHGYLSDRRLMLARDLMAQGMAATDACYRCGFRSYSSFSRAYGKLFGTTPTGRSDVSAVMEETFE